MKAVLPILALSLVLPVTASHTAWLRASTEMIRGACESGAIDIERRSCARLPLVVEKPSERAPLVLRVIALALEML